MSAFWRKIVQGDVKGISDALQSAPRRVLDAVFPPASTTTPSTADPRETQRQERESTRFSLNELFNSVKNTALGNIFSQLGRNPSVQAAAADSARAKAGQVIFSIPGLIVMVLFVVFGMAFIMRKT